MKRTLILSFSFFIASLLQGNAQDYKESDPLPVDQSIIKGVLPNGMTYYIKRTEVVKGAASYYIIQNVGSILENDEQQGLAHFLEHMAFNGTESFPGKGILNTLQKNGAVFGKDINAYTSFDETVYNMNNIPTKDGLVDVCLTVLRDWSNKLLLTEEEIDAERGVIKEEWRARQNGQSRLMEKTLGVRYNNSKYAQRMPIGLMPVVENFKYKALRDFYHDWYRSDLQAIAVIGDIDVKAVEAVIKQKFSSIPAVDNPKKRFVVDIAQNEKMQFVMATDPEISSPSIHFGIRHQRLQKSETVGDLKRILMESMALKMLSDRISELAQKPGAAFLGARTGYGQMSKSANVLNVMVTPKPNQQQKAFTEVLTEVVRAVKFGYTDSEVERAKQNIKTSYENQIAAKNEKSHESIEEVIQENFLDNAAMTDIDKEYQASKMLMASITKEELHNIIKNLYTKENRFLIVTGVEGQDNLTEDGAQQILTSIENSTSIQPYTEALAGKTLISGLEIKPGTIRSAKKDKTTGATTFILSNGVTVHYKFVNKEKNQVVLNGISRGGTSLVKDADLPSADFAINLAQMSGLGEFTAAELKKVMAGKTAGVSLSLSDINESISGRSNTKDTETMLQLVYLQFVKPRFDPESFKVLQSNINNYIVRRGKDVGEKMKDSLSLALYGANNPRKLIVNQKYADAVSFEKIQSVYKERFADISDFEFFIVGDVESGQLEPLLVKYIAGISTGNVKEKFADNTPQWLSERTDKDIYVEMKDPKAVVNMVFRKDIPYSIKKSIYSSVLGKILQLRVTATVREAEGGAYSPSAYAGFSREPKPQAFVSFSFDCNPGMADKLVDIVNAEFKKIADGIIIDEELNKIRTNLIKENEQAKDKNSYDLQLLMRYFRYAEDISDPKNFEEIVSKMTKKDIQLMAGEILKGGKSYEIVFKPKQ
ncbi:M16 family metallopeptidase [Flavobacterium luteolum]|uniref:M16 family metallopeptidase n=1 Tax=Flavobacterium luteolum TaxID=3003259 RepID=UPI00248E43CD|nr:M16 family metallopeptidase [Flavobacterium luteolum]